MERNDNSENEAIEKSMEKAKIDLRREIAEIQKEFEFELNEADFGDLFTEEELDEFILELINSHKALYAKSKKELSDLSKIDEEKWEDIFRQQVKPYFTDIPHGISDADFDAMFENILREKSNDFETLNQMSKLEKAGVITLDEIEEIGVHFLQTDLEAEYKKRVFDDPNLTEVQKTKLYEEFRENQLEVKMIREVFLLNSKEKI